MTRPLDAAARANLLKRFAAIPDRMKRAAKRDAQVEAEAMADEMKRGAPYETGALQVSIRTEDASTDTWIRWVVRAGGKLTTKPVRNSEKGNAPMYDYVFGVEFGTSRSPAQPFFYPVYRRRKRRFRARLMRELRKAAKEP